MAKTRSPNYPTLSLGEAIKAIAPAFKEEHRNKMSRLVLAKHLGYSSLNGRALTKIGAVRAYGLIEGSGDDLRVSEDAIALLNAPEGSDERAAALLKCGLRPALFQELRKQYPTTPSAHNLKYELIKSKYTPDAAARAADNYLSTMALVNGIEGVYTSADNSEEDADMETNIPSAKAERLNPPAIQTAQARPGGAAGSRPQPTGSFGLPEPTKENEIKILHDDDHLKVIAWVDKAGLKQLQRRLQLFADFWAEDSSSGD